GHIIFMDYNNTGDGLLSAVQLLHVLKTSGKKLSELAGEMKTYPQELINVRVTREGKTEAMNSATVQQHNDEVNTENVGNGRILERPSGTENLLGFIIEAQTDEEAYNYAKRITEQVSKEIGVE